MHRWGFVVLAACGRIGFDPTTTGGGVDAAVSVGDATMANAPCDVPVLIGTGTVAAPLGAAVGATSYRITWVDGGITVHVLGIERAGDTVTARELTLTDGDVGTPLGSDIAIGDATYLLYWNAVQSQISQLIGPELGRARGVATGRQSAIAFSGGNIYTYDDIGKLYVFVWDESLGLGPFTQVDQQQLLGPGITRSSGGTALIVTARPTLKDCTLWAYTAGGTQAGTVVVPADNTRCDPISGAYASVDDSAAVAYGYHGAAANTIRVQRVSSTAQLLGAPVVGADGTEPKLASSGSHFHLLYRFTTAPGSFSVATFDSALARQRDVPLHDPGTPIARATIASGDAEALAVWVEAPDQIWMRRLCGP